VNIQVLKKQFVRDLKASWKKTAALGVLFLIGLSLWIPNLVRAVSGENKAPAAVTKKTIPKSHTESQENTPSSSDSKSLSQLDWQTLDLLLKSEPLVQSGDLSALPVNPFQVNPDQFPPIVEFTKVSEKTPKHLKATTKTVRQRNFDNLVLKSTIVGRKRRAAYINRSFYLEGANLQYDGQTYRVLAVHPRKVTIQQGDRTWEISLAAKKTPPTIQVQTGKTTSE
jgi:hypothetical protein